MIEGVHHADAFERQLFPQNPGRTTRGHAGAASHGRGQKRKLPDPFFVLATQNPIEQEGTYPLPEAQHDRFMFNILVDYPDEEEEYRIVSHDHVPARAEIERVLSASDILEMQDIVRKVPVAPYVIRYAMKFTRPDAQGERTRSRTSSAIT